ncbi:protein FAM117A isoform X2 [Gallus gallus]|uniref:Family with sequence similarity 117 member A n=3 Tax=Gallus gallus TaxID=9031 RepID=A0A1D5P795_CHICK|nr:protein FAM117A isoform X2 [Gallus gallus]XP_046760392.1 protein FAM117A isoform X2 [Gallus gallus]XP_046760393.1 protein FAM117A isoform X2 [Gallus gallus]XP_046760394.1 protein FAM117A isoform X2 [Gallus gallus]XP_046760395.1 protein FAM117A isoform X2 [Gallus gallus]
MLACCSSLECCHTDMRIQDCHFTLCSHLLKFQEAEGWCCVTEQLWFARQWQMASVPCAAAAAVEKPCRPRQPRVRRTSSLDTIVGSYLLGQWPRDADGASASCMNDKATQTPVSWHDAEVGKASSSAHKRSASWGSTDHRREIAKLKQQLQRTKLNGRSGKEKEKSSPLQGDHAVLGSLRDSPSGFLSSSPVLRLSPCLHRSLEGLNQELEEVFVKEQGDEELLRILDVPDGHRAPAPAQRGSGDASLMLEPSSGSCSSLSLSPSPSVPLHLSPHTPVRLVAEELSSAVDEVQLDPKEKEEGSPSPVLAFASSPRPNHSYMFKREPPEGCEKVRAFEEASSSPDHTFQPSCPDKNKVHFNPTGSAFCPVSLVKPLFPNVGLLFRGFPASSSPATGTFTSCQPTAPTPFLGARKDAAVDNFSDASKSPSLNYEHWKRGQPEESVVFHSSLVV